MKKAKNNKGFSLVELIVVVLILGILAVAVSPQVMKWVGESRISSDKDNANALKSVVSTALADWQGHGGKISTAQDYTFYVDKEGKFQIQNDSDNKWGGDSTTPTAKTLKTYIDEVSAGDYPKAQYEMDTTYGSFKVIIEKTTGKVTVECKATATATGTPAPASP